MHHIDEKFKEVSPVQTVEKIRSILSNLGIEIEERWNDSGIDSCWSLIIGGKGMFPTSNGKGITKELARASAYGEFMERLQSGLFLYKYQSINRDDQMHLHTYAPDGKYMTIEEIEENGEWMDPIIEAYGGGLTRKKLAQQCKMYACNSDKILTMPFYSLFEDKYVYLPTCFIEQMYSANGCCVGNSRDEAWVHALSEIMERKGSIELLTSGKAAVRIPDEVLSRYSTVTHILDQIKASGKYDVAVFDSSIGNGHPVVTTRIINKKTHSYVVNTASDPVFEIALHRTLTEIFQGRNIETFTSKHNGAILNDISDIPLTHNVLNLLETGNGQFTLDFFTEEVSSDKTFTEFKDNSCRSNSELLTSILALYKALNKPVYVRNYSYLGFNCYKFIIPGFSESRGLRLTESMQQYSLADMAAMALRNVEQANLVELNVLLGYYNQVQPVLSLRSSFNRLSGIPINDPSLLYRTLAYAAYKLGLYSEAVRYMDALRHIDSTDTNEKEYFQCVKWYLELKSARHSDEKIRVALYKFYEEKYADMLYQRLDKGLTPFDGFLLRCDTKSCSDCKFSSVCRYNDMKDLLKKTGEVYSRFTDGQAKENFIL